MSIELLRQKIKELNKERDKAIFEKGLAADENKDLRENFAYDYWFEKEMNISAKISGLIREIERIAKKNSSIKAIKTKRHIKRKKEPVVKKIKDLPKNKWL